MAKYSKEPNLEEIARSTAREMADRREAWMAAQERKDHWGYIRRNNAQGTTVRRRQVSSAVYNGSAGNYCIAVSR